MLDEKKTLREINELSVSSWPTDRSERHPTLLLLTAHSGQSRPAWLKPVNSTKTHYKVACLSLLFPARLQPPQTAICSGTLASVSG